MTPITLSLPVSVAPLRSAAPRPPTQGALGANTFVPAQPVFNAPLQNTTAFYRTVWHYLYLGGSYKDSPGFWAAADTGSSISTSKNLIQKT